MGSKNAKILTYDIETSAHIGLYFGASYDTNISKTIQHNYVLGFAYKWLGQKKTYSCYIWDFPLYKKEPRNDIEVIKKWRELMEQADIVIGHNSDQFDNKVMTGRMMVHKLPPVPLPQSVDTKKAIKRVARFDSNKLDDLGETFGIGRKISTNIDLWWGCMTGNQKSQKQMVKYNIQDVVLTEKLYLYELPYMTSHPNRANIENRPDACPRCGAQEGFWSQGWRLTKTGRYRRFQCIACGSYVSNRVQEKGDRPDYV